MSNLSANIDQFGYTVVSVGDGSCVVPGCQCNQAEDQWLYTIGLLQHGLPELVCIGLATELAHPLVTAVVEQMLADELVDHEHQYDIHHAAGMYFKLTDVDPPWLDHDPSRMAVWFQHFGVDPAVYAPPVMQLIWGDSQGKFPGEPGCQPYCADVQTLLYQDPISTPQRQNRASRRRSSGSTRRNR